LSTNHGGSTTFDNRFRFSTHDTDVKLTANLDLEFVIDALKTTYTTSPTDAICYVVQKSSIKFIRLLAVQVMLASLYNIKAKKTPTYRTTNA